MSRNQYVTDLAATVNEMFAEGVDDPSAVQITKRYWGEDKAVQAGMIEEVRAKLGRIRKILFEDGHLTCPLSPTYYRRFRGPGRLQTRDEARQCLPTRGRPQAGILRLASTPEDSDLIWTEWISMQCNQGAGKAKTSFNELLIAVDKGKVSLDRAQEILSNGQELAQVQYVEITDRVTRLALPSRAPGDDEPS